MKHVHFGTNWKKHDRYVRRGGKWYLTRHQAMRLLALRKATLIEQDRETGMLYWYIRGKRYTADVWFISRMGWYYDLEELERS